VDQLRGVPQNVIDGFKKVDDDKVRVTFKTPDTIPVVRAVSTILAQFLSIQ
jgi:ABC-type transport system substrate-binding protein